MTSQIATACEKGFHHLTRVPDTPRLNILCAAHTSPRGHIWLTARYAPRWWVRTPVQCPDHPHPIIELDTPRLGVWGVVITPLACDSVLLLHVCFAHICAVETHNPLHAIADRASPSLNVTANDPSSDGGLRRPASVPTHLFHVHAVLLVD
jgi:hypothetical protein